MPKKGDLSFDQFRAIIDQMPSVTELKLQGLGEVLLNRDCWKMFEYAVARHIRVLFACNALLVDDEAALRLCKLGNIDIRFSIDTLQAERYAKIRGVDTFQRATTNVERFAELRRQHGRRLRHGRWAPSAEIRMVCMDENLEELPDLVRYAAKIGIEQVTATFMLSKKHSEMQSQFAEGKTETLHSGEATSVQEARALATALGTVRFKTLPYTANIMQVCDWPWRMPYITYDGYLTSCCHIENPEAGHFGNIFETPFEELWNGEAYREFRRNFTDLSKNTNCHVCPFLTEQELAPYVFAARDSEVVTDTPSASQVS